MAAPAALAIAPAIAPISRDLNQTTSNIVNAAAAVLIQRPEIVTQILSSIPFIALMPYVVTLIQWNLEHLEFYHSPKTIKVKEMVTVNKTRRVPSGIGPDNVVRYHDEQYQEQVPVTKTIEVPDTTVTHIRRIDKPYLGNPTHTLSPPLISNLVESAEIAQESMKSGMGAGNSIFDLIGGWAKALTPEG